MYCKNCGNKIGEESKFCKDCGQKTTTEVNHALEKNTELLEKELDAVIKCENCKYAGRGEKARSTWAIVLAWILFPLVTIIYYLKTFKYKCPKCESTLLSIKNYQGLFVEQKNSVSKRRLRIILYVLLGLIIISLISSVILASLNSARQKADNSSSLNDWKDMQIGNEEISKDGVDFSISPETNLGHKISPSSSWGFLGLPTSQGEYNAWKLKLNNYRTNNKDQMVIFINELRLENEKHVEYLPVAIKYCNENTVTLLTTVSHSIILKTDIPCVSDVLFELPVNSKGFWFNLKYKNNSTF